MHFRRFCNFRGLERQRGGRPDSDWRVGPVGNSRYTFETGTGVTPGMRGSQATHLRTAGYNGPYGRSVGAMTRAFALAPLRGKRARLSFRVKDEGAARTVAAFTIHNADGTDVIAPSQAQEPGAKGWDNYGIVLDVPDNANDFALTLTLKVARGQATSWVNDVRLDAVGKTVPVSNGARIVKHQEPNSGASWLARTD